MSGTLTACALPPAFGEPIRLAGRMYNGLLFYGPVSVAGKRYGSEGLPIGNALLDRKLDDYVLKHPLNR
jgi:hypothetical protein